MAPFTPEPASPLYQTDIAQTPLPEVLVKIHKYRAPGRLDCRRGEEVKRIYLERGDIIFATTNQIAESLGDMLLRTGHISREQYDESLLRVRQTGKRHGTVLVEMRVRDSRRYKGEGVIRINLSDDAVRIPIRIESAMPIIGTAVMTLDGLNNPMDVKLARL